MFIRKREYMCDYPPTLVSQRLLALLLMAAGPQHLGTYANNIQVQESLHHYKNN